MPTITVPPATTDIVGRRWSTDTAPEGPRRTHHHQCGAVVLEVSALTVSWQGVK